MYNGNPYVNAVLANKTVKEKLDTWSPGMRNQLINELCMIPVGVDGSVAYWLTISKTLTGYLGLKELSIEFKPASLTINGVTETLPVEMYVPTHNVWNYQTQPMHYQPQQPMYGNHQPQYQAHSESYNVNRATQRDLLTGIMASRYVKETVESRKLFGHYMVGFTYSLNAAIERYNGRMDDSILKPIEDELRKLNPEGEVTLVYKSDNGTVYLNDEVVFSYFK